MDLIGHVPLGRRTKVGFACVSKDMPGVIWTDGIGENAALPRERELFVVDEFPNENDEVTATEECAELPQDVGVHERSDGLVMNGDGTALVTNAEGFVVVLPKVVEERLNAVKADGDATKLDSEFGVVVVFNSVLSFVARLYS